MRPALVAFLAVAFVGPLSYAVGFGNGRSEAEQELWYMRADASEECQAEIDDYLDTVRARGEALNEASEHAR